MRMNRVESALVDSPAGVTSANVRQWGRDHGWEVGTRGRLNPKLVAAFIDSCESADEERG